MLLPQSEAFNTLRRRLLDGVAHSRPFTDNRGNLFNFFIIGIFFNISIILSQYGIWPLKYSLKRMNKQLAFEKEYVNAPSSG
jgi:hypothetical protein